MMQTKTLLLASDLSARSDRPTDRAFLLAEQLLAALVILHVVEKDEGLEGIKEGVRDAIIAIAGHRGDVEVEIRQGAVQEEVLRLVEERSAALVITGVARLNHIRDYFLGTAVDHLVRHAPVPTLVVKQRALQPYRRLLVATDFSENARQALETALRLFPDAAIIVWHNCHATYEGWLNQEEMAVELRREAEEDMARFVASLAFDRGAYRHIETAIGMGELHRSADQTLREGDFDLLVLGTHGRGGFAHATIGSRAAELLQVVACDTLMVRGAK